MKSYISPKTKKGLLSKIHGLGFFAIKPIRKGEVVAIKKGHFLTKEQIKKLGMRLHDYLRIDDDLYVGHNSKKEFNDTEVFINHSCSPNTRLKGKVTVIAIKNIKRDEEIVIDYATWVDDNSLMKCNCHSVNCRKVITGKDWKKPQLQKRYKGFFTPFVQKKIELNRF